MRALTLCLLLTVLAAGSAQAQSDVVYKWTDDKGMTHYTQTPPDGREYEEVRARRDKSSSDESGDEENAAEPKDAAAKATNPNAKACETARKNLQLLESDVVVTRPATGEGEPQVLSTQERAKEVERNRAMVAAVCEE